MTSISVVVPVRNGAALVPDAHRRLGSCLARWGRPHELVLVDDGSTDGTWAAIEAAAAADPVVRGVSLRRNVGQAGAIAAGIRASAGRVIATTDVDLETEPDDLLLLVAKVDAGAELASGRRRSRRRWAREVPSQAFNLYGRATGTGLRDLGCGTNALSRRAADAYAAVPDLRRELPTAVLLALGHDAVEVDLRSRRPSSSQLGHRDLLALLLAFEARRGLGIRGPGHVAAAVAMGALLAPRGRVIGALGAAAVLSAPGIAGLLGRQTIPAGAADVVATVGTGLLGAPER